MIKIKHLRFAKKGIKFVLVIIFVLTLYLIFHFGVLKNLLQDDKIKDGDLNNFTDDFHVSYIHFVQSNYLPNIGIDEDNASIWPSQNLSLSPLEYVSYKNSLATESADLKKNLKRNCGLDEECSSDSVALRMYTGMRNEILPELCIDGKYLSSLGRGINMAVIGSESKDVVKFRNFDTFAESSGELETFLETLRSEDLIIVVTHDEATRKLSSEARSLLTGLGSALIQDLDHRDGWVFVGQKGIEGFSGIEHIEYINPNTQWPKPIDKRMCLKTKLTGNLVRPDELTEVNHKRRELCSETKFKSTFCNDHHVDRSMVPSNQNLTSSITNDTIFKVPIIIVPGSDATAFAMQAEALALNPGLRSESVHIFTPDNEILVPRLARLFDFNLHTINISFNSATYKGIFKSALERSLQLFSDENKFFIILQDGVLPSDRFLGYLATCIRIMEEDDALDAALAWNDGTNSSTFAIRSSVFPRHGFMMRRKALLRYLTVELERSCSNRSLDSDISDAGCGFEAIIPGTSKAYKIFSIHGEPGPSSSGGLRVPGVDFLYDVGAGDVIGDARSNDYVTFQLSTCRMLSREALDRMCSKSADDDLKTSSQFGSARQSFCLYYHQDSPSDVSLLSFLVNCLKASYPAATYMELPDGCEHLIRLKVFESSIFLIGSRSPFVSLLPKKDEIYFVKHADLKQFNDSCA